MQNLKPGVSENEQIGETEPAGEQEMGVWEINIDEKDGIRRVRSIFSVGVGSFLIGC